MLKQDEVGVMDVHLELLAAAKALLDDVRRRYPGEELRCPYMRALDTAVKRCG